MIYCVSGPPAVGKSVTVRELYRCCNLKVIVPYTTRNRRDSDIPGLDYHFYSYEALRKESNNFSKGFWDEPFNDGVKYGYMNIDSVVETAETDFIIQASSIIALALKREYPKKVTIIFLDYSDKREMARRIEERLLKGYYDTRKRNELAIKEINNKDKFEIYFESNNPFEFSKMIINSLNLKSKESDSNK